MTKLTSPHDKFFRETWSRKEVIQSFLEHQIPVEIRDCLNLKSLHLEKDSFINTQLKSYYSDMLYSLETREEKPIQLYLLFEHKSYPDGNIFLQLLWYMLQILEAEYKQNRVLIPVLPFVVYHGQQTWQLKPAFQDVFDLPEALKPYVLNFQPVLCDLTSLNDEDIVGQALARVTLLTLKHIFDSNLPEQLPKILGLLNTFTEKETVLEFLHVVLRYVSSASNVDHEHLKQAVETALPQIGESTMATLAEQWIAEGEQRGYQKGESMAAKEAVLSALKVKYAVIPSKITQFVNNTPDVARLKKMLNEVIRSTSLASFEVWLERYPEYRR